MLYNITFIHDLSTFCQLEIKSPQKLKYRKEKREFIAELSSLSLLSELNDYFIFKRLYEYVYIVLYIVYTSRIRTFDTYQYYKANN